MTALRYPVWLRVVLPCLALLLLFQGNASSGKKEHQVDGASYQRYFFREIPWSIHVVRIERGRSDFSIVTTLGGGTSQSLNTLTRQLRTIPRDLGTPIAAINGDFYITEHHEYAGDPRGLHILRGELISGPARSTCTWFDEQGNPHMGEVQSEFSVTWPSGANTPFALNEERSSRDTVLYTPAIGRSTLTRGGTELVLEQVFSNSWLPLKPGGSIPARVREIRTGGDSPVAPGSLVLSLGHRRTESASVGDILMLSTGTKPALNGVYTAIGGGPVLVRGGQADPGRASKSHQRHPRSAIGWNSKHVFFVEVDGRQRGLSVGMSLDELADFLVRIGCEEAMNLDGGGSAELWFNGRIMSSPCYGHERSTATAIVLLRKEGTDNP